MVKEIRLARRCLLCKRTVWLEESENQPYKKFMCKHCKKEIFFEKELDESFTIEKGNKKMDKDNMILMELIHIRCLLEGMYLDSREAKDYEKIKKKGCTLNNVEERSVDLFREYEKQQSDN